jgi:hypothetical protein
VHNKPPNEHPEKSSSVKYTCIDWDARTNTVWKYTCIVGSGWFDGQEDRLFIGFRVLLRMFARTLEYLHYHLWYKLHYCTFRKRLKAENNDVNRIQCTAYNVPHDTNKSTIINYFVSHYIYIYIYIYMIYIIISRGGRREFN